ncbi:CDP-alcohol phosphatidyltransferase [Rhodothermus marinus SG0.5JP17-172]|uniref:CDP-alcohol phosphatidyltransferase family protein n=1 Tax=Rhodothermus marinus TaxID=29549 RepID=UPI000223DC85|nr:CDP-alcohol phosphatidyltransferase family protein [Rhodothermus marinus]AEN73951.1 CDP-alcohol phosphatidyltransferase [Rhodothermus marinus SG0.5JP17-172]MBO2492410.1 CDP-alcohol phosphatidyltransferase family protein [Rhodothermus marinus]
MSTPTKLPDRIFRDFSAFGLGLMQQVARRLAPTRLRPVHITWLFLLDGLLAAWLVRRGQRRTDRLAALLLVGKHLLDGLDGALARHQRPSRLGRYFDSIADFVVNVALFAAVAERRGGRLRDRLLSAAGLLAMLLQGSLYNFYYVRYRHHLAGERTSLPDEREARPYPWDPPRLTRLLQRLYLLLYGWQDRLVARLDVWLTGPQAPPLPSPALMTALSTLGLGLQLAVAAALLFFGQAARLPQIFLGPYLLWSGLLLGWRAREARALTRSD